MEIHHGKHHNAYVTNLNKAISEGAPNLDGKPLHEILANNLAMVPEKIKTAVRNNGGGHHNHSLFWEILNPAGKQGTTPIGNLANAINSTFGSFDKLKEQVNAAGVGRFARYHWQPVAGLASQPLAQLRQQPADYLYEELERRLLGGPVAFTLELEFAEDGDPTDDCTVLWPEGRERVTIGRLELTRPTSLEELGDPVLLHDATRVTDGIELSADPILQVRRGAYRASVAQRTGGWQQRQAAAKRAPAPSDAP
jgi:hypothetical protein